MHLKKSHMCSFIIKIYFRIKYNGIILFVYRIVSSKTTRNTLENHLSVVISKLIAVHQSGLSQPSTTLSASTLGDSQPMKIIFAILSPFRIWTACEFMLYMATSTLG